LTKLQVEQQAVPQVKKVTDGAVRPAADQFANQVCCFFVLQQCFQLCFRSLEHCPWLNTVHCSRGAGTPQIQGCCTWFCRSASGECATAKPVPPKPVSAPLSINIFHLRRVQVDSTAQQFTQEQLKPAAKQVADGAENAASELRARGESAANYVDEQGEACTRLYIATDYEKLLRMQLHALILLSTKCGNVNDAHS